MVLAAFEDREAAIELFQQNQASHLMGKCHAGQAELLGGSQPNFLIQAQCAADDKGDFALAAIHLALNKASEFF